MREYKLVVMNTRIPQDTKVALKALAAYEQSSLESIVMRACDEYLERHGLVMKRRVEVENEQRG